MSEHPDLELLRSPSTERVRPVGDPARDDVLAGLAAPRKRLPARLLRDPEGLAMLARLEARGTFYPARAERALLAAHGEAIANQLGPRARVIEPVLAASSGDVARTLHLLRALERPARYVRVDAQRPRLATTTAAIGAALPGLEVEPVGGLDEIREGACPGDWYRTLVFLPGSAIACHEPSEAVRWLRRLAELAELGGMLLFSADATTDPAALVRAYADAGGVGEARAKHALAVLNRTHAADFDPDAFSYRVAWNAVVLRAELQLVSRCDQRVRVAGEVIALAAGEAIALEHRYQHTAEALQAMLGIAGWWSKQVFTASPEPVRLWSCERLLRPRRHPRRTRRWWRG